MDLSELRKSITELSEDELEELIKQTRASRRVMKAPARTRQKSSKTQSPFGTMSKSEAAALLELIQKGEV